MPAPFGPISAWTLPGATVKPTASSAVSPANADGEVLAPRASGDAVGRVRLAPARWRRSGRRRPRRRRVGSSVVADSPEVAAAHLVAAPPAPSAGPDSVTSPDLQHVRVVRRARAPAPRSARPAAPTVPCALISRMVSAIRAAISGASPSDGSSSSSSRGPRHQRPADGEHLLLAAGQQPGPLAARARPGPGTARTPAPRAAAAPGGRGRRARRPAGSPPRVSRPNTRRPSGTWTHPGRHDRGRVQAGEGAAAERDRARR